MSQARRSVLDVSDMSMLVQRGRPARIDTYEKVETVVAVMERPGTPPQAQSGKHFGPQSKATEFATPKVISSKAKVIHKEKLLRLSQKDKDAASWELSSSRLDGIPTAHVRPHAASQPLSTMDPQLRRAQSSDYLATDMLPPHISPAGHSPGRPWGSVQNLPVADNPGEFKCLDKDLDQTMLYDQAVNGMDYMNLNNNYPTELALTHRPGQYLTPTVGFNHAELSHMRNPHTNSLLRDYRTDQPPNSMPSHLSKDLFNSHATFATPHKGMSRAASLSVLTSQGAGFPPPSSVPQAMSSGQYDMTSWQVRRQEQLQTQQIDLTQGMYPSEVSLPSVSDPTKLDSVQWAHSQALVEKNRIISSHKQRISLLEQQEGAYSQTMMKHLQDERDKLGKLLQDYQCENSHLKGQLKKQEDNQNAAEKKLGEREYEMQNYKENMDREMTTRNVEVRMLQEKLSERGKTEGEWKEKFMKLQSNYEILVQKDKSTERYLADVPTAQDLASMKCELLTLKEDKQKYKTRVKDLERHLNEANQAVRARDNRLEGLRHDLKKEKNIMDSVKGENNVLRGKLGLPVDTSLPFKPLDDVDELKDENKRLESKCEAAKKFVDLHYQKLQSERQSHATSLHELRERLEQEEATGAGLRVQVLEQDTLITKQRDSLKEMGRANQDFKMQNLTLKERIAELERQGSGEIAKLERRLHKELAVCFSELYSLVQICVQRAEGQDPNISVLLGVKANSGLEQEQEPDKESSVAGLKQKLSKIKELRQEVDKLRELVSNKYAEDLANNLTCATQ